ncbi:MAG TPA: hypothetical protein VK633_14255 [Verrucomicrobiae bacterium]|nr:hypothetical protein [Verrucomicrobiae bacterium]
MDRPNFWPSAAARGEEKRSELDVRVLRNKLINLTLDWELAAHTLDSQRYKMQASLDRESLRDSSIAYRKCIAELTEILSGSSTLACKTQ